MNEPESILVKETHKILWDFEMRTDYLLRGRQSDQVAVITNRENMLNSGLWRQGGQQSDNKGKKKR